VGHPFGLRGALTVGVVSSALPNGAAGRARELVRADVLLGPGNSGGPLADARGRVVGINAMVVNGMALAVPSHLVERLLARRGEPPVLGIAARDVTLPPAQAARAGLPSGAAAPAVLVVDVAAGGAAERAGVLLGDVLCTLDGRRLAGTDDLLGSLEAHPGGPLHLGLLRGGVGREVVVLPPPTLREGHAGTGPEQPAPAVRQNPAQPERRAA
jgi:serine protease Do